MTTQVEIKNKGPGKLVVIDTQGSRHHLPKDAATTLHVWDGASINIFETEAPPSKCPPRPQGRRILVKDPDHQTETAGGLILVGGDRLDLVESTVISVGIDCTEGLRPGDRVVHTRMTGVRVDGETRLGLERGHYRIIKEEELLAALAPSAKFEGGTGFYNEHGEHHTSRS